MIEKDLARSGKPLFQWRKYSSTTVIVGGGLVILGFGAPLFDDPLRQFSYDAFWIAVALAGGVVRIVTSGFAALGTSGEGKAEAEAQELNTTGAYSVVRNPLYVGRLATYTGLAFLTGVWPFGVMVFLATILFYERVIAYEEQYLSQQFGDAYAAWCARVPALMPKLSGWQKPTRHWWWRRLFFRETYKVLDVFSTIVAYGLLKNYAVSGEWVLSPAMVAAIGVLGAGYVIMTALKRFTKLFDGIA